MPMPREMMMTVSPELMTEEPTGMMTWPWWMMTAMRTPRFNCRSYRGVCSCRVVLLTANSAASAPPSAMRYRAFITLPLEFCIPRTT